MALFQDSKNEEKLAHAGAAWVWTKVVWEIISMAGVVGVAWLLWQLFKQAMDLVNMI